eukprot:TRINITY_DN13751_c0_g1_i2.p1 TRINITY_DN13751_c0_g1~~TRINITY_DN13751_c0_g1_i2.p1  ORF type:complete len:308 (-),score=38.26 TRINITY_DN13751_c0_g1_i2:68-991(-)
MNAAALIPAETDFAKHFRVHWTSSVVIKYLKQHFTTDSFSYEVVMILFLYGLLLRNQAQELLGKSLLTDDFEKNYKEIARLLCFAAGVFDYIKSAVLPNYGKRPPLPVPELAPELYCSLVSLCLGEAQQITLRKAFLQNTSPILMSKLSFAVHQCFVDAQASLVNVNPGGAEQFIAHWRAYMAYSSLLYHSLSIRYLGQKAKEESQHGIAVVYLTKAFGLMPVPQKKVEPPLDRFLPVYDTQRNVTQQIFSLYTSENDTIYFSKTPSETELEMPVDGKLLMKIVPYQPPTAVEVEVVLQKGVECCVQ